MKAIKPLSARFWPRVAKTDTCWLWTGYIKPSGHGQLQRGRRGEGAVNAHLAAWELLVGPLPQGCVLHHLCDVKPCVNPAHLKIVTRAEHPSLHTDNVVTDEAVRNRGGEIGRCSRWRMNRGLSCLCGVHEKEEVMRA